MGVWSANLKNETLCVDVAKPIPRAAIYFGNAPARKKFGIQQAPPAATAEEGLLVKSTDGLSFNDPGMKFRLRPFSQLRSLTNSVK